MPKRLLQQKVQLQSKRNLLAFNPLLWNRHPFGRLTQKCESNRRAIYRINHPATRASLNARPGRQSIVRRDCRYFRRIIAVNVDNHFLCFCPKRCGPHPIPDGGILAGFTDPEGHLIGLVQGPK